MSIEQNLSIPGIVRNGVIVPQVDEKLPEGSHVEILIHPGSVPPELMEEISAWDRATDEAWNWIDEMEAKGE
jgi:hypothetical protein